MKLQLILLACSITLFTGCGTSDSSSATPVVNTAVTTACDYTTATLTPTSSQEPTIQVDKSSDSTCTLITLTSGTADIVLDGASEEMTLNKVYSVVTKG